MPSVRFVALAALFFFACPPTDTAKLYKTSPKAPSLDATEIQNLEHLGPTLVDQGVNFGVYSENAERIELLLFDDPESTRPTRQFPLERFGNVWNLHVQGIGLGQHYGFIAWGPNWPYDPKWVPGSVIGFKADVDADGNRFNPNKLLFDPYGKAIHRDHDWSKGSLATGPARGDSTWAAASKSIVVQSKYTWSDNETTYRARRADPNSPGHKAAEQIVYELHPKGFTASTASGVEHPGTFRGLGEKVAYLKELGVTAVEIMPPFEKPPEGGYWGYSTLSFFIPENSYSSTKRQEEIIDEFKWMVDQLHQADIEVIVDVVYNHTGEGGFWRERLDFDFNPDNSIPTGLVNIDPKEVVGLYSYRGFDNQAYYALSDDKQSYMNNTGVGNETR
ncbi:MAG: alpha-amylase family glycosyl hydrolase, partial [Myxococcaceae bacterium]